MQSMFVATAGLQLVVMLPVAWATTVSDDGFCLRSTVLFYNHEAIVLLCGQCVSSGHCFCKLSQGCVVVVLSPGGARPGVGHHRQRPGSAADGAGVPRTVWQVSRTCTPVLLMRFIACAHMLCYGQVICY